MCRRLTQHGNKTVSGGYTQDNGTEKLNVDITREEQHISVTGGLQRDPRCADAEKCADDSARRRFRHVPTLLLRQRRPRQPCLNQTVNDQLSASLTLSERPQQPSVRRILIS